ncbi:kynurenine--oxoglutarate transaminase 3-like [Clytia hemisphaerica]|uniref:Aminotransferase class I/classII large domain-containing protein n=1 Tax=Clytia hemisphaerica TaxID=252671 RepID=A0A7M5V0L2_9CNID
MRSCKKLLDHYSLTGWTASRRSCACQRYQFIKMASTTSSPSEPLTISKAAQSVPENVWVKSVKLVQEYKPVNLGQGFPDFPEIVPKRLRKNLCATQADDAPVHYNQYARGQGQNDLVRELALLYSPLMGRTIDPMSEILVTVGAYESLHCAVHAVTNPGDEVILIEPYFDSYGETVRVIGATARNVPLKLKKGGKSSKDFVLDKEELRNAFNEKTKCIIVNTPHNPTGKMFDQEEIEFIADLCKKHNVLYISDEVYEWLHYENKHVRVASLPGMWERTITICSAGKTFNATGFKTGWALGPKYLISAAMGIHQGIIYTVPTPLQIALAETIKEERALIGTDESYWKFLNETMTKKREEMFQLATEAGLNPIKPDGGYFMVMDLSNLDFEPPVESKDVYDQRFCEWLVKEKGIAAIPISAFFSKNHKEEFQRFVRFCFIKGDSTMQQAAEKLRQLNIKNSDSKL